MPATIGANLFQIRDIPNRSDCTTKGRHGVIVRTDVFAELLFTRKGKYLMIIKVYKF